MSQARRNIVIKSNDYDECFAWLAVLKNRYFLNTYRDYLKNPEEENHSFLTRYSNIFETFLKDSAYGKKISEQAEHKSIDKIILISGSNRQTLRNDAFNRLNNFPAHGEHDNGSAFLFLDDFTGFLEEKLGDKIQKDQRTMADIWNNKKFGSEHQFATEEYKKNDLTDFTKNKDALNNLAINLPVIDLFNSSKITLLYAQIHSFANEFPENNITFEFYDDNEPICDALYAAFSKHPELLPKNVELKIYQYDLYPENDNLIKSHFLDQKLNEKQYPMIQGTGKLDRAYKENVKILHKIYRDRQESLKLNVNKILPADDIQNVIKEYLDYLKKINQSNLIKNSLLKPVDKVAQENTKIGFNPPLQYN